MSSPRPQSAASMEPAESPNTPGRMSPMVDSPDHQQQIEDFSPGRDNLHTPLPVNDSGLEPPRASFFDPHSSTTTPRDSYRGSSINDSSHRLSEGPLVFQASNSDEPESVPAAAGAPSSKKRSSRPLLWLAAVGALIAVVLIVILPVYFTVIKKKNSNASSSAASGGGNGGGSGGGSPSSPSSAQRAVSGGNGSMITMDDGTNFTYTNPFGGFWYYDPEDPFNNNAQPNSWTPPLNTSWTFGTDKIYGVNIGGLFVLEPFISPALFQEYPGAIDEWSLSTLMGSDLQAKLENHYNTFITEEDIAQIAGAGLNWIRVPIPFWAIEVWEGEPFLEGVCWKYIVRLLGWARKYGLRVNLDLHTIPGSQNGFNHSGKFGIINFLNGVMGVANAQRALNYIRIITEFISQPEWADVVPIFGVVNEARMAVIGRPQLNSFYLEVHDMMRNITGVGAGKGPYMSVHDGFQGVASWAGFMPGSDRVILDSHPYTAFNGPADEPIASGTGASAGGTWPARACNSWGKSFNSSRENFGVTIAGEMSAGFNDCGLYLRGVNVEPDTSNCGPWQDSRNWTAATKAGVLAFTMASMDALEDYFFWTWKIGNSTAGYVESPLWSYKLGLASGWIPADPRTAVGKCTALGIAGTPFDGTYKAWQTGGAGAGTISATWTQSYGVYPPATLSNAGAPATRLPQYTSTGTVATLPPPTLTASATHSISVGDGWFDASDTALGVTAIAGCTYPDAWSAVGAAVPTQCGGKTAGAARAFFTPPPMIKREMD